MQEGSTLEGDKPAQNTAFFKKSLSFRSRFMIGTALSLLITCFVGVSWMYEREKRQLEEYAYGKTKLVMAAVEASRDYVREDLRPTMYEAFGRDFFLLQAMSTSYVGRAVMENFNQVLPQYEYRRVAENARNPDSEANTLEKSMIAYFEENPRLRNWKGMLDVQGQKQFMRFKPVIFRESCMRCHGRPEDAPGELLQRYGRQKGFGNQPGELAGVVAVGIPVQSALMEIKDKAATVFMVLFAGALFLYLALVFLFNRVVVNNLRGVLHVFREEVEEKGLQDAGPEDSPHQGQDEFYELTEAAVTMSEHLHRTRLELKQYAQDLESKVDQRTQALQESKQLLQEKVLTRNRELQTLNRISELTTQASGLKDVWPRVLKQGLELIPAQGAGVYLLQEESSLLELQYQENAMQLPWTVSAAKGCQEDWSLISQELSASICQALSGRLSSVDGQDQSHFLNIPMSCRGKVLGVLSLAGLKEAPVSPEMQELLLSVGRQMGIAVQSLKDLQRLVQSKELLQTVFDGITDLLLLLDRDGRIKMVNKAYLSRFGVQFRDIEGQPCYEAHAGLADFCPECALGRVVQSAVPSSEEMHCASGEIFQVHFYPILNESGEVQSVIRNAREISEQKKMEQSIQQTEKMVALGQLASGVAHEINNPLGIILCYVDLLKRQLQELPQGRQDLEVIEKQVILCKQIVTDLLQFARGQESVKERTRINRIIQEVTQMFNHTLKKCDIQVQLDLEPELPEIRINADKIRQVLVNLLLNALQAVPAHGSIQISSGVEAGGGRVWISIWDNGQGVQQSIQGKIFEPFFSTKETGEGTGLGLAVSYGIVQDHGGEISLQSEEGSWSRFTVFLPLNLRLHEGEPCRSSGC
jgi:PAS domain S-box-containing protein